MEKNKKNIESYFIIISMIMGMIGLNENINIAFAEQAVTMEKYYGDINKDGKVDTIDEQMLIRIVNRISSVANDVKERCDLNGDGNITQQDVELIRNYNEGSIAYFPVEPIFYGDLNLDGKITVSDLAAMIYAQKDPLLNTNEKIRADLNGDGNIDEEDLDLIKKYIIGDITYFPVQNMLKSIQIKTKPGKLQYNIREKLNTAGMTIEAYYNNGYHRTVTDWTVYGDTNTAGDAQITVSYIEGAVSKTASYTISVKNFTLKVNPTSLTVDSKGNLSQSYISVDTNNTGNYHIFSNSSWLKVGTGGSKYNAKERLNSISNNRFYVFADENTSTSSRSGTLTVTHASDSTKSQTITVIQEENAEQEETKQENQNNQNQNSPNENNIKNPDNSQLPDTDKGIDPSTDADDLQPSVKDENMKDPNEPDEDDRAGNFNETEPGLTITPEMINANIYGDIDANYVKVLMQNIEGFAVTADESWIHISETMDGIKKSSLKFGQNGIFYIFVDKTNDSMEREGTITVTGNKGDIRRIITVRQAELIPMLNINVNTISVERDGSFSGGNEIAVSTEGTGGFTASIQDADWLRIVPESNAGFSDGFKEMRFEENAKVYLAAKENTTGNIRSGQILFTHSMGSKSMRIHVTQSGGKSSADSTFIVDTQTHDFDRSGKGISTVITITADSTVNWTVTSNDSTWLKVSKDNNLSDKAYGSVSDSGNGTFYIMVEKNETYEERGEWIYISAPGYETKEIYVTQAANEAVIASEAVINQIKFSTSKKTFRIKKSSKIRIYYPYIPEIGIEKEDVANSVVKIQYKSTKPKIVSVSKKGVIKGRKKGKGKVSVKITLADDARNQVSRTVTVNVKVGKGKVNIKAFKG